MNKTKVIEFTGKLQDGGAETLVKDYVSIIDKSRFEITVLVLYPDFSSANSKLVTDSGVNIITVYKKESGSLLYRFLRKFNAWWYVPFKINKVFRTNKADVLHAHVGNLVYLSKVYRILENMKLFYTCHSLPSVYFSGKLKKEKAAAKKLIKTNGLRFVALHEDMRRELNNMFGVNNTVVIRNGIDFRRFDNIDESKDEIRAKLNIPKKAFVIGHVGRFAPVKNHSFLVDVFNEVCRNTDNAFLLLVGSGDLKSSIEQKLDGLGFHGKYLILSHRSDIPMIMKAMDVFAFPSLHEGLGIALIEAQVAGLRCIVSDKVPAEAFQTEFVVPMSLDASVSEWCRVILNENIKGEAHGNIEDYDMNKEIKRLEKLYLGELNA